jgi:hypothetical protein
LTPKWKQWQWTKGGGGGGCHFKVKSLVKMPIEGKAQVFNAKTKRKRVFKEPNQLQTVSYHWT